jgi:hypothetical protein
VLGLTREDIGEIRAKVIELRKDLAERDTKEYVFGELIRLLGSFKGHREDESKAVKAQAKPAPLKAHSGGVR